MNVRCLELRIARLLLAILFFAGAVQKVMSPDAAQALLAGFGWPVWLVWPAMLFNAGAAMLLLLGRHVTATSRALALYCLVTSVFHYVPDDPWQMSILIKNWAIAGGLLALAAAVSGRR